MWKTVKASLLGLGLFFAVSCGVASAQTTKTAINNTTWTNVGTGPLFLSTIGHAWYAVSGTSPSLVAEGFDVPEGGVPVNTAQAVWVRLRDGFIGSAYTYATSAGTFSGTITWPGTAGNQVGGTATGGTMPYVNSYEAGPWAVGLTGTLPPFASTPTFNCGTGCGSGGAGPLGVQSIANSQAVNPATSSVWPISGAISNTGFNVTGTLPPYASTPTFNCGTGCGSGTLTWPGTAGNAAPGTDPGAGTMPYVNTIVQNAPARTLIVGTINAKDLVTVIQTLGSFQDQYQGVPTPGSVVSTPVTAAGDIEVQAAISGGTANVQLHMEISQDNVAWYGRGLFLDGNTAPIWINGINGGLRTPEVLFTGTTSGFGVEYYRVRATNFAVLTGTPVVTVTIKQSNRSSGIYSLNNPTSAAGVPATAATNVQFGGNGFTPFETNAKLQAGLTLAAPTAPGTPAATGLVPTVNVANAGTATVAGLTLLSNTLSAPLTPGLGAVSSVIAPTGGNSVALTNTGTGVARFRLSVGSGTATANDMPIQPGSGCVAVLGPNTWINVFGDTAGAVINATAASGLGNCPTGGGGGTASSGSLTWPGNAGNGIVGAPPTAGTTAPYVNALLPDITGKTLTVANPAVSPYGAPGPASGASMGANGAGGSFAPLIQTSNTAPINITSAVTTVLVPLSSGKSIYVTSWDVMAPAGNFTLEYGTGALCAGSTVALTGPEAMNGGQIGKGIGLGVVFIVPPSNGLCAITTVANQYSGSVSFAQF